MDTRLGRRHLLTSAALAAPAMAASDALAKERKAPARKGAAQAHDHEVEAERSYKGMNVLLFIIDQQRAIQHFPKGWEEKYLPGITRLKQNGLSFENAVCNTSMCSPSRSTLFSGYFPAQHGVKYTLEADMPSSSYPQVEMPTDLPNLATVMTASGFATPFKGKWHCSKAASGVTNPASNPPCVPDEGWAPSDLAEYGFERWNPQDAGANQDICQAGGGSVNNDGRFMFDDGDVVAGQEGAIAYLEQAATQEAPFFLTVSLVNPHDVLAYPANYKDFGYTDEDLKSTGITRPETADEKFTSKPSVQRKYVALCALGGLAPTTDEEQVNYLNFYGNLMRETDAHLVTILDTLDTLNLSDNTVVILTADHGEMGTAHGGMIQKNFNFYEETLRVPLVYSNRKLYPKPVKSTALVSHVDFLPTMASLFRAPESARAEWQGVDYSSILRKPKEAGKDPQAYTVFTFDDWQSGQASGPYLTGASHIVAIRKKRYKLARYYDPTGNSPDEWEMYDRKNDPLEERNLAFPGHKRTKQEQKAFKRMRKQLAVVEKKRLQPLASESGWANETVFGSQGTATDQFEQPNAVYVPVDDLTKAYICDGGNNRVSIWSRTSSTATDWTAAATLGSSGSGLSEFNLPAGVDMTSDQLTMAIADTGNNRISIWTRTSTSLLDWTAQTSFGSSGSGADQFKMPFGVQIAQDGLSVYVADFSNNRISAWTRPDGASTAWTNQTTFGTEGTGASNLSQPNDLALSSDGLTMTIADLGNNRVSIWTRTTATGTDWANVTTFGTEGSMTYQLNQPDGIFASSDGSRVWIADRANNRISLWMQSGGVWSPLTTFGVNGQDSAELNKPDGVCVLNETEILIADRDNNRMSVWTATA
jgi:arylsulfatase A-like enzyme/DNA-binding beta-propeller fold protein YncE